MELEPGCDYSIKVKSPADESLFDMSDDAFICDGCGRLDDLAVLAGEWPEEQSRLITYLYDNGKVDVNDFAIFAENWTGASCP